jgi:hypothetical protein
MALATWSVLMANNSSPLRRMKFSVMTGEDTSAVRTINDRINEIVNKKDGKATTILTNVLSPDGNTIANTYMRMDADGTPPASPLPFTSGSSNASRHEPQERGVDRAAERDAPVWTRD